jgi:hypothetical protein
MFLIKKNIWIKEIVNSVNDLFFAVGCNMLLKMFYACHLIFKFHVFFSSAELSKDVHFIYPVRFIRSRNFSREIELTWTSINSISKSVKLVKSNTSSFKFQTVQLKDASKTLLFPPIALNPWVTHVFLLRQHLQDSFRCCIFVSSGVSR